MKQITVREELLEKGIKAFTLLEFERIFRLPKYQREYFLETQTKLGLFIRLKRGLYMLKSDPLSDEEIANVLYKPSYLSFEYALSRYGIIPEATYSLTSATTNPTRAYDVNNLSYEYYTIKQKAYTGYFLETIGEKRVLIAEPEKALADYLYFVSLGKKSWNDRFDTSKLDKSKLLYYLKLFNKEKFKEFMEKLS